MKKIRYMAALLCMFLVNVLPVSATEEASLPRVVDNAEILSDAEESELTSLVNDIATVYQIDVVLITENQRKEADIQAEADMLFDTNGYGIGEKKDGVLFVLDMGNREWAISTHGDTITLFSDYDLNSLGQTAAQNYFANGRYRDGFVSYVAGIVKICEKKMNVQGNGQSAGNESTEENGAPAAEANGATDGETNGTADAADKDEKNQSSNSGTAGTNQDQTEMETSSESSENNGSPGFAGALIITIIYMVRMKKGMKKARKQQNADVYQNRDASMQIRKSDVFLTTSITKTPVKQKDSDPPRRPDPPRDSDSHRHSRTTTTVHTSDNGETHGGASGKF